MKLVKINNKIVKPLITSKYNKNNVKGYDLFADPYGNIFLCAKKKSGKTSVINEILTECVDKDTILYIFCSTHNKDANYVEIKKYLKEHDITANFYTSIIEEGVNMLEIIRQTLQQPDGDELTNDMSEEEDEVLKFDLDDKYMKITIKKKKKIAPKYMFVFDDMSTELKTPEVNRLLKQNRHYKCKVIVSSQYPNDLAPDARKQLDYWLLFAGHNGEKLEEIYKICDLNIPFEQFEEIYQEATKEKYNFLYIDRENMEFRKNFNEQFIF